jgi:hypothetical protein
MTRLLYMDCKVVSRLPNSKYVTRVISNTYGIFIAKSQVLLTIALGHLDGVVDIINGHSVVGNVLHQARSAATLEISRERRGYTGPDFDASTVLNHC